MGCFVRGGKKGMGCYVRGDKNSMGCYVRGDKNSMGCSVRGGKSLWDVLSGVSKNGMGCFVPGCFVRLPFKNPPKSTAMNFDRSAVSLRLYMEKFPLFLLTKLSE